MTPTPAPSPSAAPPDCLLTLAVPRALEEELIDVLMAHPGHAPGFTLLHGFGLGSRVQLDSAMEQVQGRARRVFVQVALPRERVAPLLALLAQELQNPAIAWWLVPLLGFGRLGDAA